MPKESKYDQSSVFLEAEKNYERLTIDKLNNKGAINLVEAIVKSTAIDYSSTYTNAKKDPKDFRNAINYYLVVSYMRSQEFNAITLGNGRGIADSIMRTHGKMSEEFIDWGRSEYLRVEEAKKKHVDGKKVRRDKGRGRKRMSCYASNTVR